MLHSQSTRVPRNVGASRQNRGSFRTMAERNAQFDTYMAAREKEYACFYYGVHEWLEHNRAATDHRRTARAVVCHKGITLRTSSWAERA